jgi:uncharacterized phage protein (TIGR02218 family)
MTTAKVSQSGAEYVHRVLPGGRASQAGIEYLHTVQPGAKAAQAGVEYLHRVQPSFAISQAGAEYLYKHVPCGTRMAQAWTITRSDGAVRRFTSLDRTLTLFGESYRSCGSLVPSAAENVAEVDQAGSIDLSGALGDDGDSGAIGSWDLYSGKYDGARVEGWLVSWDPAIDGWKSRKRLIGGTFAPVQLGDTGFSTEVAGDGAKLQQTPLVFLLQPGCRWTFGDPVTCQKDLGPLTVTGTVDDGAGVREFTDAARTEPAGYFKFGRVSFTGGANAGISAEIKEHAAGGAFTLWPRLPFAIAAGDTYSMTPGCTNLKDSVGGCNGCTAWGQLLRYGGWDKVPGRDKRGAAATVRT